MICGTKFLNGRLEIKNIDNSPIYFHCFRIPAIKTIGPDAKRNILKFINCDYDNIRCVKHLTTWRVTYKAEPSEEFCFRRQNLPDIKYNIFLNEDADHDRGAGFWERQGRFSSFLKKVEKKQLECIELYFCDKVGKLINAVSEVTKIRYLFLNNCSPDCDYPVFQEIGQLEQLRGLWLHGFPWLKLDRDGVRELRKLKNSEALRVGTSFPISVEALHELGTLKNLKYLYLELWNNCNIKRNRRATLISVLSALQGLENLEILVLDTLPRLSPHELALPPKLKYLEINHRICHLPVRSAKTCQVQ